MTLSEHVVDNRVFLLGLDKLYREAMKNHERSELLACARRVSGSLGATPAPVPVEGYYAEDAQLTEYFRLVRTLQQIDQNRQGEVAHLPEFQRLLAVTSAPLYGLPQQKGKLLPAGRDALSQALLKTQPEWTVRRLTEAAREAADAADDISLVGLAARIQDAVVLAAMRESVVLYAEMIGMAARHPPKFVWQVDKELGEKAQRFIDTFNRLFGEELPPADPAQAEAYWNAYRGNEILGRCVRLGHIPGEAPNYHWAICKGDAGKLIAQEFWHREVWTTARYRAALHPGGGCPALGEE